MKKEKCTSCKEIKEGKIVFDKTEDKNIFMCTDCITTFKQFGVDY